MQPSSEVRRARRAISAVFFANGACWGSFAPTLPVLKELLGVSNAQIGSALLSASLAALVSMPLSSRLISRFGSRNTCVISGVALLFVMPFVGVTSSLGGLIVVLFLAGLVAGQMDVGMNSHAVGVQERHAHPVLSSVHGWFSLGGLAGGLSAALSLRIDAPLHTHFLATSGLLALVLAVSWPLLLPADVERRQLHEPEVPWIVLPKGPLVGLGLLVLMCMLCEGVMWDWAALYLSSELGAPEEVGALGFSALTLAMAVGRFAGDPIIARLGHHRALSLAASLCALGMAVALSVPVVWTAFVGFILCGFGLANTVPILFKAAGRVAGVAPSIGLAAVTTMGYTAFLVGPPFIGKVADITSLRVALCVVIATSAIVAVVGPRTLRAKTSLS